jgi:uncharacterized protein (DUF1015 family)
MSEAVPFRALRYAPEIDLAAAICPPFDVISPEEQHALRGRSPHNAVRIELAEDDGDRYRRAAETLRQWREEGTLRRDDLPAFYAYRQQFQHGGRTYGREMLFARLRLEEWERGVVLPHEQTFGAPKEDRLKLLRATGLNTSPVFLLYRDDQRLIAPLLAEATAGPALTQFEDGGGQSHALWRIDDPERSGGLARALAAERLYVADGHHRYETALAYRDERRAAADAGTGEEPENFALVALTAAADPGLLVLPIHRLAKADVPFQELAGRLGRRFTLEAMSSLSVLETALGERGRTAPAFGLAVADSPDLYLVTPADDDAVDALLPRERSADWRRLDAAIATHAILRDGMGLDEVRMSDITTLWFTEDAGEAVKSVRGGRARYALLLNPVPVPRILDLADAGERMPQKSTFFHPKVPTGLLFNSVWD